MKKTILISLATIAFSQVASAYSVNRTLSCASKVTSQVQLKENLTVSYTETQNGISEYTIRLNEKEVGQGWNLKSPALPKAMKVSSVNGYKGLLSIRSEVAELFDVSGNAITLKDAVIKTSKFKIDLACIDQLNP